MEMARYACYNHFEYFNMLERSIHDITKQLHHGLFSKKEVVIKIFDNYNLLKVHITHHECSP